MSKKIKQIVTMLLVFAMFAAFFSACGSSSADTSAPAAAASSEEAAVAEETEEAEEAEEAPEASEAEEVDSAEEATEPEVTFFPLDETQEITIWNSFPSDLSTYVQSHDDYYFTKNIEEILNVDLVLTDVSDVEVDTLFPIYLAAGDYDDIVMFGKYTGSYETAVEDGLILDLTDYMDEYAPDYKAMVESDPVGFSSFTSDEGRYYGIYGAYTDGAPVQGGLATRTDWMEEAGVTEVPSTISEMEEYLTKLRDAGHSNALWMDSNGSYYSNYLSAAFGVSTGWGSNPFILQDGKIVCSALQPGMKDYLQTMARWYENDLIDKDFATNFSVFMTELGDVLNGKVGIWVEMGDRMPTIEEQLSGVKLTAVPFPTVNEGDENHYVSYREHNRGALAIWTISGDCEDIELALRFLNYGFSEEGNLLYNWGVEGESYTVDDTGKKIFVDEVLNHPLGLSRGLEVIASSYMPCAYDYDIDEVKNAGCAEAVNTWSTTAGDGANLISLNNLTTEENEVVNGTGANDFNTYFKENSLKFMTGELNFETDWDTFIANIESMNVQEICDAYQAAYDRRMGN